MGLTSASTARVFLFGFCLILFGFEFFFYIWFCFVGKVARAEGRCQGTEISEIRIHDVKCVKDQ